MSSASQLILFIGVLAVLKFVFGLPISIVGSLLLTLALSAIATAAHGRSRG